MADFVQVQIEAPSVKVLTRKLSKYPEELKEARKKAMIRSTRLVQKKLRQKNVTPFKTGRLSRGWKIKENRASVGKIVNRVPYAPFMEFGTSAHVILPRKARALRFKPKGSAKFVFAKRVLHPGTKPFRMTKKAIAKSIKRIRKIWVEELEESLRSIKV